MIILGFTGIRLSWGWAFAAADSACVGLASGGGGGGAGGGGECWSCGESDIRCRCCEEASGLVVTPPVEGLKPWWAALLEPLPLGSCRRPCGLPAELLAKSYRRLVVARSVVSADLSQPNPKHRRGLGRKTEVPALLPFRPSSQVGKIQPETEEFRVSLRTK